MIPAQITGEIFCGDPFAVPNEFFETGLTVVDVIDIEFATNISVR